MVEAVGGAALVFVEATAVEPIGRISPHDSGIWDDRHVEPFARIARFVRARRPLVTGAHFAPASAGGAASAGGHAPVNPGRLTSPAAT